MYKRLFPIFLFLFFSFLAVFSFITNTKVLVNDIILTLKLWLYYVYPSIFIFYIISNTLLQSNLIQHLTFVFKPFIKFESNKAYELLILSIFVGNPTTASLVSQELQAKKITHFDALKLLREAAFFNPLFVLSLFSLSQSGHQNLGFLVLVSIILTNMLFLMKRSKLSIQSTSPHTEPLMFHPEQLITSVTTVMNLLLNVAGIMVLSNILRFSLLELFSYLPIKPLASTFLVSTIEVTTGAKSILSSSLPTPFMISVVTILLTFQGLSINMQVYTIIKKDRIAFAPIFLSRLIQAIFAGMIVLVLYLYCSS